MPLHAGIIVGTTLAVIGSGYVLKKLVYDPHLAPIVEAWLEALEDPASRAPRNRRGVAERELVPIPVGVSTSVSSSASHRHPASLRRRSKPSPVLDPFDDRNIYRPVNAEYEYRDNVAQPYASSGWRQNGGLAHPYMQRSREVSDARLDAFGRPKVATSPLPSPPHSPRAAPADRSRSGHPDMIQLSPLRPVRSISSDQLNVDAGEVVPQNLDPSSAHHSSAAPLPSPREASLEHTHGQMEEDFTGKSGLGALRTSATAPSSALPVQPLQSPTYSFHAFDSASPSPSSSPVVRPISPSAQQHQSLLGLADSWVSLSPSSPLPSRFTPLAPLATSGSLLNLDRDLAARERREDDVLSMPDTVGSGVGSEMSAFEDAEVYSPASASRPHSPLSRGLDRSTTFAQAASIPSDPARNHGHTVAHAAAHHGASAQRAQSVVSFPSDDEGLASDWSHARA